MSLRLFSLAIESAERGDTPPREVIDWYLSAILAHLQTGESLDKILGLRGGGKGRQLRTIYLTKKRNHHLYRAWELFGKPTTPKDWQALAVKVRRAGDIKKLPNMPPLSLALYHAHRTGPRITNWKVLKECIIAATVDLCQPSITTPLPESGSELEMMEKTGT